ncbi:hypothetical protein [Mucisphaera sp.]|uniref:hypothetical protein n=1 Tax=Mucisphaera sp. TaxID=2913024 RepID=UPI003D0C28F7
MRLSQDTAATAPVDNGYGRARLWLGISGVGLMVLLAATGLLLLYVSKPVLESQPDAYVLASFVGLYAFIHTPLDWLGGYLLPHRYNRPHPTFWRYLANWSRGVAVHSICLFACAMGLLFASSQLGAGGAVIWTMTLSVILLWLRRPYARLLARLTPAVKDGVSLMASEDQGFTGGLDGMTYPRQDVQPQLWHESFPKSQIEAISQRRAEAGRSGLFARGRLFALVFIMTGSSISASAVGSEGLATAVGVIQYACAFTLWSFLGLLVLPTLSRNAATTIDHRLTASGTLDESSINDALNSINTLQDAEQRRPAMVETVFHPIRSPSRRQGGHGSSMLAAWDVARITVYMSLAGLSLLGRAVHCNVGRPALWAYLPSE